MYSLPNKQGYAFAYMPKGPKQRALKEPNDSSSSSSRTPCELVRKQFPCLPSLFTLSLNFPTLLSTPNRDTPSVPNHKLLLNSIKNVPGTLKDSALELRCEMWPSLNNNMLKCHSNCGELIHETVLVRDNKYYHPQCVCYDCEKPMVDPLKVPWIGINGEEQYYHPDCTCQFCYKPFINSKNQLKEDMTINILADSNYRYENLRYHLYCPKIKSPGYNVITCSSCDGIIHDDDEELMKIIIDKVSYSKEMIS